MAFPHGLRALNHPPFRSFFLAQLVALVGTWMQTVSQAWLVLQLTDSPFKLGLLGTLQFGPLLLLSPFAGVIADRWPRRRLLVATQAALVCAGLVVLSTVRHFWTAVPVLFMTGFAGIITVTGCNTAIQLGAPDELRGRVMSLYTWVFGGAFPIGSFLVGATSERHGVSGALLLTGTLGLGLLALLATTRPWRAPKSLPGPHA